MSKFWQGLTFGYMMRAAFSRDSLFTDVMLQLAEKYTEKEIPTRRSAYSTFRPPYNRPRTYMPHRPQTDIYYKTPLQGSMGEVFDESNENWDPNPDINELFLRAKRNHFDELLQTRGHVFLNEVFDALGFDRTKDGAVLGWLREGLDEEDEDKLSSLFTFSKNENGSIDIYFNTDGIIFDRI